MLCPSSTLAACSMPAPPPSAPWSCDCASAPGTTDPTPCTLQSTVSCTLCCSGIQAVVAKVSDPGPLLDAFRRAATRMRACKEAVQAHKVSRLSWGRGHWAGSIASDIMLGTVC